MKNQIMSILEKHQNDNLYSESAREIIADEILDFLEMLEKSKDFIDFLKDVKLIEGEKIEDSAHC